MFKKAYLFLAVFIITLFVLNIARLPLLTGASVFAQESSSSAETGPTNSPTPFATAEPSAAATPTENPTASPTASPDIEDVELVAVVVPETSATSVESLDLDPVEATSAQLVTDKADYAPTDTAVISGTGLAVNTTYNIVISSNDPPAVTHTDSVTTDENGGFVYAYQLDGRYRPNYSVVLKDQFGNTVATTTFTDKPAINLDQCANGGVGDPPIVCSGSAFQNGNLGQSQAHYLEGDSVPYRAIITGVEAGVTYTAKLEYDTTQSGKHAIDYLTSFDRTEDDAAPCTGVAGVPGSCAPFVFPIPLDPNISGAGVTQPSDQNFTIYNGTITGASAYTLSGTYAGSSSTSLIVTFTANANGNAVLAWGGHIGTRADWGQDNSAVFISGSPYHMRVIDFTCSNVSNCGVGNQDRSLSAEAIIAPALITITKVANPQSAQDFAFTTTGTGLSGFSLDDDSDTTLPNNKVFSVTSFGTKTVLESATSGWALTGLVCEDSTTNSSININTRTATLNVAEGDVISCTFTNEQQLGNLIVKKVVVNDNGGAKIASDFSFQVNGGSVTGFIQSTDTLHGQNDLTVNTGTYSVTEPAVSGYTTTYSNCTDVNVPAGGSATCTITNNDQPATLTINKVILPPSYLDKDPGSFNLLLGPDVKESGITDQQTQVFGQPPSTAVDGTTGSMEVNIGSHTVSETGGEGTDIGEYSADMTCNSAVSPIQQTGTSWDINLVAGSNVTCTIVNQHGTSEGIGTLNIVKNTIGGDDTFNYTGSSTVPGTIIPDNSTIDTNFSITTSGGPTGTGNKSYTIMAGTGFPSHVTLTETTPPAGWSLTSLECISNLTGSTFTYTNNGTTANILFQDEDSVTCTYTNTKLPKLTVTKVVINDNGGTKEIADFPLFVDAGSATSGVQNTSTIGPHSVSETVDPNYTSVIGGDCAADGSITLAAGDEKECTITNDDKAPSLTLVKEVTNNNGGNVGASNWTLTAAGPTGIGGSGPSVTSGSSFDQGTYNLSESGPSGYDASAWVCVGGTQNDDDTVAVGLGQNVICTITNNDVAPTLKLVKVVTIDNGGSAVAGNWVLTASGGSDGFVDNGATGTFHTVTAGVSYTLSELGPSGYTAGAWSCNGGNLGVGTVTLGLDDDVTCTITNDDQVGHLIVNKVTNPGQDPTVFSITLSSAPASGSATQDLSTTSSVNYTVNAGTYSVSESDEAGWDETGNTCVTIAVANGETKNCTITNTKKGHLVVQKTTLPAADVTAFTINATSSTGGTITGGGAGSVTDAADQNYEVTPGTYSVSETTPAGWDVTGNTCTNVVVAAGQTSTCLITNTKRGHVIIQKNAIPDGSQEFTFNNNFGNENPATFNLIDTSAVGLPSFDAEVLPGEYAVSENQISGWQSPESTSCDKEETVGSINVGPGETVTCTFVNEKLAKITLVKNTVGGNGDFDFDAIGAGLPTDIDLTTVAGTVSQTFENLDADNTYSITENVPAGWDLTSSTCTGGNTPANITPDAGEEITCTFANSKRPTLTLQKTVTNDNGGLATEDDFQASINTTEVAWDLAQTLTPGQYTASEVSLPGYTASVWGTDCANNGSVTLAYGDNKVCTVTNDDDAPSLTLVKVVDNGDGGTAVKEDWTLAANGPTSISGAGGVSSDATFDAGTYTLSESTGPSGYSASEWTCEGGIQNGNEITLGLGQSATCTITNNDIAPKLTLEKTVINDNGGTATESAFQAKINNDNVDWDVATTLSAGAYTASEVAGVTGYAVGTWGGACAADGSVTLAVGDNKTCTITNDDISPQLIVKKHVINDNGGNASASAFTMLVTGNNPTQSFFGGDEAGTTLGINAGSYNVGEIEDTAYAASYSADCEGSINVGETKTCTITNDDKVAHLTAIKHVVNDNGGNAVAGDFTMNVDATNPSDNSFPGDEAGTSITLDAGSYSADESSVAGYTKTLGADCSGTVANGETRTCTITNDDIAPTITLNKVVNNNHGGPLGPSDFDLNIDGNEVTQGVGNTVSANTPHLIDENPILELGYDFVSIDGDEKCPDVLGGLVTLDEGENITCTITNEDIAPKLTVIKHVDNNYGGTATSSAFTMNVSGTNVSVSSFPGEDVAGTIVTLNQGEYNVTEGSVDGYQQDSASEGCSGSINVGEEKVCTITNSDVQPMLIVFKHVINDNGGTASASAFTLDVTGNSATPSSFPGVEATEFGTVVHLNAGGYSVDETEVAGYTKSLGAGCSGTLAVGDIAFCTVTNDDQPAHLTVNKILIGEIFLPKDPGSFDLLINGDVAEGGIVDSANRDDPSDSLEETTIDGTTGPVEVDAGENIISEQGTPDTDTSLDDYQFEISCKDSENNSVSVTPDPVHLPWAINLANGDNVTCTITNFPFGVGLGANQLIVVKHTIGGDDTFNFNGTQSVPGTLFDEPQPITIGPVTTVNGTNGFESGDGSEESSDLTTVTAFTDFPAEVILTEDAPPSGWDFTDVSCIATKDIVTIDPITGEPIFSTVPGSSTAAYDYDTRTAYVTFVEHEEVICTYTNTKRGHIVVDKVTNPSGNIQSFDFTAGGTGYNNFSLTDAAGPNNQEVVPGTYSVSEGAVAGWDSDGGVCDNDETPASLDVAPGETVHCTITNTQRGHLIVQKTTNPAGDPTSFSINVTSSTGGTITGGGAGTITDATNKNYEVTPGTYSVAETVPSGWDKTGDTCQNVVVGAGETKTCIITNTKEAKITLEKVCDPDDALNTFNFTSQRGSDSATNLSPVSCGARNVVIVPPTTDSANFTNWTITEAATLGWNITDISCTGGGTNTTKNANSTTVGLDAGEDVKCTFTNFAPPPGRITGGGSIFTKDGDTGFNGLVKNTRITHGFTLHCNALVVPNRLEINWSSTDSKRKIGQNNFHLTSLVSVQCIDDLSIDEQSPDAPIDTIEGIGIGKFNGVDGYKIHFVFTDAGEPGVKDASWYTITPPGATTATIPTLRIANTWDTNGLNILLTPVALENLVTGNSDPYKISQGNQQAHK